MPLSLHAAFVPSALQMLGTTKGLVEKAREWAGANDCAEADLLGWRMIEDMAPFAYQVKSVAVHSGNAIEGALAGKFSPDFADPPSSFDGLLEKLDAAVATLEGVDEAALEAIADETVVFEVPNRFRAEFLGRNFLLSFSQPNYYFHATAAYALMRAQGIPVGKVDFLGAMRVESMGRG